MFKPEIMPKFDSIPLLSSDFVRSLVDVDLAVQAIEQAYLGYGRERHVLSSPPAMLMAPREAGNAAFKVKGARLNSCGIAGFRMIADRLVDGNEQTIDLCWVADAVTGRVIGLVDETWLHRLRTALTGVVAAKWLARPESRIITIIGAGKIADELPGPLRRVFDMQEIRVVARRMESATAFARRHAAVCDIKPFADVDQATANADIVICISAATAPLLCASALAPGVTVCGMGGGPEIDADVLDRADRFIVDDLEYSLSIGSVCGWLAQGRSRDNIARRVDADLGEIALGAKPGRTSAKELVLAIVQGMACCDLALANLVLTRAGLSAGQA